MNEYAMILQLATYVIVKMNGAVLHDENYYFVYFTFCSYLFTFTKAKLSLQDFL